MADLVPFFEDLEPQMIEWLCSFINSDTPSGHGDAINSFVRRLAGQLEDYGAEIQLIHNADTGDHLLAQFLPSLQTRRPLLILGHTDTVWDIGESRRRPAHVAAGKIYGPGAFDMRGGLTLLTGLAAYFSHHRSEFTRPITVLLDSDEEVGSHTSRSLIETEARHCEAVLVLEPCLPGGALKTFRKGVGNFVIRAKGVAAHAGVDYNKGVSAIQEIAHQVRCVRDNSKLLKDAKRFHQHPVLDDLALHNAVDCEHPYLYLLTARGNSQPCALVRALHQ